MEIREFRERAEEIRENMAELDKQLNKITDAQHMILELMTNDALDSDSLEFLESQRSKYQFEYDHLLNQRRALIEECKDIVIELNEKENNYKHIVSEAMNTTHELFILNMDTVDMDNVVNLANDQLKNIYETLEILNDIFDDDPPIHNDRYIPRK